MTRATWQRLQEVFEAVADLEKGERAAVIEARCGGDEGLRRMVESLLHSEQGSPIEGVVEAAVRSAAAQVEGEAIPNFRIIRRLGEGGMGVVYEAEQARPHRKVALKLIRAGQFAGERERRLFEREAEALARLAHAGIASIYEVGQTPAGQPYLVMEFVEGVTLTEYVASLPEMASLRRGDVGRRVELFLEICEAVSYAHQRGVIHRDLKPANIMVSNGKVKVLDFGLARIETEMDTTRTETGVVQGSLRYMSPEQARGESSRIDTRSDVYALGVVLYEMLTGGHPYLDRTDLLGAVYQICETPMRSLRVAKKPFSADLETILGKALAKEPGQRYDGPAALAADLRRFLVNETILARPVTLRYQLGKLIARNKVVSAALGVILVLVVGFAVFAVQQSVRIAAERDRANQEAATANEVAEFLVRLFRETNPTETDGVLTAKEILLSGRKRLDTELKQKPEIRARLLETIGDSFTVVGPVEEAVRAYEESLRIRGEQDARAARILRGLGDAYYNLARYEESVRAARRALELDQKFLDPGSETTSKAMNDLALSLAAKGDLDEAATLFAELEKRDQRYGRQETVAAGAHLAGYGSVLRRQKKYTEAIDKLTRGVGILRKGEDQSGGLRAMNDLGLALNLTKRFAEADQTFEELLRETKKIFGEDHPNNAVVELNRMNSWIGLKRYREAAAKLEALRPRIRSSIPLKHPVQCDLASAYADAIYGMNPAKGLKLMDEAIVFCSEQIGPKHPNVQQLKERRREITKQ